MFPLACVAMIVVVVGAMWGSTREAMVIAVGRPDWSVGSGLVGGRLYVGYGEVFRDGDGWVDFRRETTKQETDWWFETMQNPTVLAIPLWIVAIPPLVLIWRHRRKMRVA